jgi:stalled ribosome alternative rescue factor ArfA
MRKTVASAGKGSRDEARDDKKDFAMTMRKTKQKPEQQLGMSGSWCPIWSKCETSASSKPLTRASFGDDPARLFRKTIESQSKGRHGYSEDYVYN